MFFLAGAAASDALGLISSLQQALGGGNSAAQSPATFDPTSTAGASANAQTSAAASAGGPPAAPLSSATLNAMFSMQGQGQQPLMMVNGDALGHQIFSLLDGNGDGAVSQSEFDAAFGQNGNTTQANSLFAQIDTNADGSISQDELTNALEGQDQAQGQGQGQGAGVHGHHHHHHGGGFDIASLLGGTSDDSGAGGAAGASDSMGIGANAGLGADLTGDATQTVTNSDGSSTTTITYADGSQVTMTIPAANSSSSSQNGSSGAPSAATLNNFVEQMIQRQAQLLASTSVGQSVAVSA